MSNHHFEFHKIVYNCITNCMQNSIKWILYFTFSMIYFSRIYRQKRREYRIFCNIIEHYIMFNRNYMTNINLKSVLSFHHLISNSKFASLNSSQNIFCWKFNLVSNKMSEWDVNRSSLSKKQSAKCRFASKFRKSALIFFDQTISFSISRENWSDTNNRYENHVCQYNIDINIHIDFFIDSLQIA